MINDFGDPTGKGQAKRLARFDRNLAGIHRWYLLGLDDDDRRAFRNWIDEAARVSASQPFDAEEYWMDLKVAVVCGFEDPASGEWQPSQLRVDPQVLAKAVAAWDAGDEYVPAYVFHDGE